MTIADSAADLYAELIENASLLEGQFIPEVSGVAKISYTTSKMGYWCHWTKAWGEQVEDVFVIHCYQHVFSRLDPPNQSLHPD